MMGIGHVFEQDSVTEHALQLPWTFRGSRPADRRRRGSRSRSDAGDLGHPEDALAVAALAIVLHRHSGQAMIRSP